MMYAKGKGVPQDDAEAVKWFQCAAEHGDADMQCRIGKMYEKGEDVPQDNAEAVKWYRRAVIQEDEEWNRRWDNEEYEESPDAEWIRARIDEIESKLGKQSDSDI